jgi:hypothetical protein
MREQLGNIRAVKAITGKDLTKSSECVVFKNQK